MQYKLIKGLNTHTSASPSPKATGDNKDADHFTQTGVSTYKKIGGGIQVIKVKMMMTHPLLNDIMTNFNVIQDDP